VSSDELIGNIVQVTAYDLRLRADPQKIVADTLDQRGSPARRDGAEGVPCVAGDKAELGGLDSKLSSDNTPGSVPAVAQPFFIGVAVLRDQRGDLLRMTHGQSKAPT
jgi:hypothetical protein